MEIPWKCIWCLKELVDSETDESHVLPECLGNDDQQVLPKGVVCKKCNQYFGQKVEPVLLRDPLLHIMAVVLRLRDPDDMNEFRDKIFDTSHPPVGEVKRNATLNAELSSDNFTVDVKYSIEGRLSKTYRRKDLAFLSRAVHKIAYESLAWSIYVKGIFTNIDMFSTEFDYIRDWSRRGQPINFIRPVVRKQSSHNVNKEWKPSHWIFPTYYGAELNLFGDYYVVSLTSPPHRVEDDLRERIDSSKHDTLVWVIGDKLKQLYSTN